MRPSRSSRSIDETERYKHEAKPLMSIKSDPGGLRGFVSLDCMRGLQRSGRGHEPSNATLDMYPTLPTTQAELRNIFLNLARIEALRDNDCRQEMAQGPGSSRIDAL